MTTGRIGRRLVPCLRRWDFAGGIDHANWLLCTCTIMDEHGPRHTATRTAAIRSFLAPVGAATVQAAGTNAIYRKHPLERFFRGIHVAVKHAAGFPAHFESAG